MCPGYDDVFDGAHRPQNRVVRRRIGKQDAAEHAEHLNLGKTTPKDENTLDIVPTASLSSTIAKDGKPLPKWIVYSMTCGQTKSTRNIGDIPADLSPSSCVDKDFNYSVPSIPYALEQNAQDASLCFFFRHYAGTSFDPEAYNGFNQLWRPMYGQASIQSPLRLATAAVTVTIALMWRFQGCNSQIARSFFTRAVTAAREALNDPLQRSTDETLMTILVFDLYDALMLHYTPGPLDYGKHKYGALAIIEDRGFANLTTARGRTLIAAVRHSLLAHMLSSREAFPKRLDHLFDHSSVNDTKVSNLDMVSVRLSRVQSRLWTLRLEDCPESAPEERRACYEEIIAEAFQIEKLLLEWRANTTGPDWLPDYVSRDSVMESIQDAGFYGSRCSVWADLSFGGTWLLFCMRYLLTLQIMRQSFADDASLLSNLEHREILSKANKWVQRLVDYICEMIPFHLGDNLIPTIPIYSTSINYPYKFKTDPKTGMPTCLPRLRSNHQKRAAASGGWIIFPQLVNVWRLAEPEDDAVPIVLREGQLDWIKGQVRRLQKVFLFCEPVWFKRAAMSAAKRSMN